MTRDSDDTLHALLAEWYARRESGERPDATTICRDYPELLPAFERIVGRDETVTGALTGPDAEEVRAPIGWIDDFELLTRLGAGGRGEVFLARERSLGRLVALKLLRSDATIDERARRRLLREAELTASLDHPNIVPIYSVGQSDGRPYIVMKWLSGPSLEDADLPLAADEVARIGAAIARALHAAHLAGVTHRDVKPGNIMLDENRPYVLDFGLARSATDLTATVEGKVSGTLPYMSPEQLGAGSANTPLDGRTDTYSLGATLYELACGHPPFAVDEPGVLIRRILLTEPEPLGNVPRDLRTIVERALAKEPRDRFESAAALAEDLERFRRGEPIASVPTRLTTRIWKRLRRHPVVATISAASVAFLIVAGGLLLWQELRHREQRALSAQEVFAELVRGNIHLSAKLLAAHRRRFPQDVELSHLDREHASERLLSELLDRLQQSRERQDPQAVAALIEKLDGLDGFERRPERKRAFALARAAGLVLIDNAPAARIALREVESSRARAGLEALLNGTPWPWTLPEETDESSTLDHLICAIAMRAARVPAEAQRAEIDRALEHDETDYRARVQQLIWLSSHGKDPDLVLVGLGGLLREQRYSRAIRAAMVREAALSGDPRKLDHHLSSLLRDFPRARWNEIVTGIVIEVYERTGRVAELDELIDWASLRWPESWMLSMARGRRAADRGDLEALAAELEVARKRARYDAQREEIAVATLDYRATRCGAIRRLGSRRAESRRLLELARTTVNNTLDPWLRHQARTIETALLCDLGQTDEARRTIEKELTQRSSPRALLEAANVALRCGEPASFRRGLAHIDRLRNSQGGPFVATPRQRMKGHMLAAYLAGALGDLGRAEREEKQTRAYPGVQLRDDVAAALANWLRQLKERRR